MEASGSFSNQQFATPTLLTYEISPSLAATSDNINHHATLVHPIMELQATIAMPSTEVPNLMSGEGGAATAGGPAEAAEAAEAVEGVGGHRLPQPGYRYQNLRQQPIYAQATATSFAEDYGVDMAMVGDEQFQSGLHMSILSAQ